MSSQYGTAGPCEDLKRATQADADNAACTAD